MSRFGLLSLIQSQDEARKYTKEKSDAPHFIRSGSLGPIGYSNRARACNRLVGARSRHQGGRGQAS